MAPIALVIFAIAALIVLTTAGSSDKSSDRAGPTRAEQRDLRLKRSRERARTRPPTRSATVYVVKTGDTLGAIAEKTGVPVEKLQELNPNLDPQALVSGQRIKLR
jgi:LysM repeat protein